jgi:hypothetical protein
MFPCTRTELTVNPPEGITVGPLDEDNFFEWEALVMYVRALSYVTCAVCTTVLFLSSWRLVVGSPARSHWPRQGTSGHRVRGRRVHSAAQVPSRLSPQPAQDALRLGDVAPQQLRSATHTHTHHRTCSAFLKE